MKRSPLIRSSPGGTLSNTARLPEFADEDATMDIKAAVVREKGGPFLIEDLQLDGPTAGEVLVKVVACGICHTDLIIRDQFYPTPLPVVLGHEGSGIVEAVGPGIKTVRPGDHVLMSFAYCGTCPSYLEGP